MPHFQRNTAIRKKTVFFDRMTMLWDLRDCQNGFCKHLSHRKIKRSTDAKRMKFVYHKKTFVYHRKIM